MFRRPVGDSRNRLTAINGPGVTASFKYDALERRSEKTVNGQTIGFVYDGAQAIGEVTGGTISTALLTGLAIDEVIARYSQTGNRTYLTDALGSVIAQAKDDQTTQNFYGYSPYGQSTALGPDEGNPIQYTGRENDQTGLLYYRARFYDPVLKRFISEDPIGLAGGPNVYTYTNGNPINLVDPTGNASTCYSAGPDCSGAGPGNSGAGGSIVKTPPDGTCWKAVWRGGTIVRWEPCYECPKPEKGGSGGSTTTTTPTATAAATSAAATPTTSGTGTIFGSSPTQDFKQCVKECFWTDSSARHGVFGKALSKAGVVAIEKGLFFAAEGAASQTIGATAAGYAATAVAIEAVGTVLLVTGAYDMLIGQPFAYCVKKC